MARAARMIGRSTLSCTTSRPWSSIPRSRSTRSGSCSGRASVTPKNLLDPLRLDPGEPDDSWPAMRANDRSDVGDDKGILGFDIANERFERGDIAGGAVNERESAQWRVPGSGVGDRSQRFCAGALASRFGDHPFFQLDERFDRK